MHKSTYIFSYGSNLLFQRIKERVASVQVVRNHQLKGYQFAFNKHSIDGSTKANIVATHNSQDQVWGVIHKISLTDKPILDEFEALGKGYDHLTFHLEMGGSMETIYAYMATDSKYLADGRPYDWYYNFVLAGAMENDFPEEYIRKLKVFKSKPDTDLSRKRENEVVIERSRPIAP